MKNLAFLDDTAWASEIPNATLPQIDPDARRRRLAAMVNAAVACAVHPGGLRHRGCALDRQRQRVAAGRVPWLSFRGPAHSYRLTYRPEYDGALAHAPRSQTIALEPLDESQMLALGTELLGGRQVSYRTCRADRRPRSGNPFFAEEIVRDLSERDVLVGGRGCYLCVDPITDIHVPGTLQAVIAARIDRLDPAAKRTLNAAAVIGSRFTPDMLQALGIESAFEDLVSAELIDQTAFHPQPEYAFRHPLIRAVAYELTAQIRSRATTQASVCRHRPDRPERRVDRRAS